MAIRFALHGHSLALISRNKKKLQKLKEDIIKKNINTIIEIYECDTSSNIEAEKCYKEIRNKFKNIDVLINNANTTIKKGLLEISSNEWMDSILSGLNSAFNASKFIIPEFIQAKKGIIVNIGSLSTKIELERGISYTASKYALNGFSKSLIHEFHEAGVKICTMHLGSFCTTNKHEWKMPAEDIFKALNLIINTSDSSFIEELTIRPIKWPN